MLDSENPVQIAEKTQIFEGLKYYLCGKYYQRDGVRLHRKVWETYNGSIPDKHHIHHINGDRSDNRIENLECMKAGKHLETHWREEYEERLPGAQRNMDIARDHASVWHGSKEGREWHRKHYYENRLGEKMQAKEKKLCLYCDAYFEGLKRQKFCSNNCKSGHRRERGTDNEERICSICEGSFTVNRYSRSQTCGRSCRGELRRQRRRLLHGS